MHGHVNVKNGGSLVITVVDLNYEEPSVLKEEMKSRRFWYPGMLRRAVRRVVSARASN